MPASDSSQVRTVSRPAGLLCGGNGELLHANMANRLFGAPGIWNLRHGLNQACGLCWLDSVPMEEGVHLPHQTHYTDGAGGSGQNLLAWLTVTTPNIQSFSHEKFRDCCRGLGNLRHMQIFSAVALADCARKALFTDVNATSSAANADTIIGGSFNLQEAKRKDAGFSVAGIKFNFLRGMRSLFLQYRESWLMRRNPKCGEEVLLICHK